MRMSRLVPILWHRSLQPFHAAMSLLTDQPFSLLSIQSDLSGWVLEEEAIALQQIAAGLGIHAKLNFSLSPHAEQCCHYTSQFVLRKPRCFETNNRVSVDYFHGLPKTSAVFMEVFNGLRRHHSAITRLRVSHSNMEAVVLESGIDEGKVHRIPIGINLDNFDVQTKANREKIRRRLGLPQSAIVIGSFQKDGDGWGSGMEPKLIKGPDIFLKTIELLKLRIPELYILLSGPSRGFVKEGLTQMGVPFRHVFPKHYKEVGRLFQALDLYLVTSREEGGPKAILESMASHVPLVTTRVGQAVDLVKHGRNAWMVDAEDVEGLAHWAWHAIDHRSSLGPVLELGRQTAEMHRYEAQWPDWSRFFKAYVE